MYAHMNKIKPKVVVCHAIPATQEAQILRQKKELFTYSPPHLWLIPASREA
jgi:hypothetical protein